MLRELIDKLIFHGLSAERKRAVRRVVARYSRGNVTVQDGRYLTKKDLDRLRADGDRAAARLRSRFSLSTK